MSINNFDVLKKLQDDNCQQLKAFPLSNIRGMQTIKNGLGIIQITVDQETVHKLIDNQLIGSMIVADEDIFNAAKKEMEQANDAPNDTFKNLLRACKTALEYMESIPCWDDEPEGSPIIEELQAAISKAEAGEANAKT